MVYDTLKNQKLYYSLHPNFEKAFAFINKAIAEDLPVGRYEIEGKELYAAVSEYTTKDPATTIGERHENYIDIQVVIRGREKIPFMNIDHGVSTIPYDAEKDAERYEATANESTAIMEEGTFAIFFPQDIHRPNLTIDTPFDIKKVLAKVKL